jgi:hypothetical protein
LEAVAAGEVREITISPKLAIASFIVHDSVWQAAAGSGSVAEMEIAMRNAPVGIPSALRVCRY